MKKTITILAAILVLSVANAQYNETNNLFYHTFRSPQTNQLNPALFPNATFYLQLPAFYWQLGFPMSLGEVITHQKKANVIDINNIIDNLNNPFRMGMDVNVVGFGLKVGHLFIDANTQLRTSMTVNVAGGLFDMLLNGNMDEHGNAISPITIADDNMFNMQSYLETSLGVGYQIDPINLTVGVHAKLLSGLININTDNTSITIETDNNFDSVTARIYYQATASSSFPIDTTGGMSNIMSNMTKHVNDGIDNLINPTTGNTGLAFDIGAKYTLGPLTISAAINDLTSGIHWQNNVMSITPQNKQGVITFSGMDINNLLDGGQMTFDSLQYILDELATLKPDFSLQAKDYWYTIPTKINLAASFDCLKVFRLGLLLHGQFDRGLISRTDNKLDLSDETKNTFRFNTTATVGINLFNWIELIGGTSVVYDGNKYDFFNPGGGLIFSLGTFLQSYIMLDYMSSFYFTDSKAFNVKFGMNMMIGKGGRKRILDD